MDLMFEWEYEGDRFSFEDSDRFEEDSLCSWGSEPELCNNWRGWKRQNGGQSLIQIFQPAGEFLVHIKIFFLIYNFLSKI